MTAKKPRPTKDDRERLEVEAACAACAEFAALMQPLVGFEVHVEPVQGVFLKRGGAVSLGMMKAVVEGLKKRR